jgi:outer membrane biosynthesis protein TonB
MMRAILTLSVCLSVTGAFAQEAAPQPQEQPAAPQAESAAPAPQAEAAAPAPQAEAAAPAPQAEAAAPATKPKASANAPAAAAKPKASANAPAAAAKPRHAATSSMSQSKFLGLLYSEIAKHTPKDNKSGPGAVTASFRVNASGRIDNVSITNSSSAAHASIVRKILASVQAPPPPNGAFDVSQSFKFH